MYHEATACNMVADLSELFTRLLDFLGRTEQCKNVHDKEGNVARPPRALVDWVVGCSRILDC